MPRNSGLLPLLYGSATVLVSVATCSIQAQVTENKSGSSESTVVAGPVQTRALTRVIRQATPPRDKSQEVRIERRIVDGDEQIELWIDGEKVDVDDMNDVHEALADHDIQFVDKSGAESGFNYFQVEPGESPKFKLDTGKNFSGPFTFMTPDGVAEWTTPKSMLGVQLAPISDDLREYLDLEDETGVRITGVIDDSPAAQAGLQARDIIIAAKIGSESHESIGVDALRNAISEAEPDTEVSLTVLRKGEKKTITAKLAKWDAGQFGMGGESGGPVAPGGREGFMQLEAIPHLSERFLQIQPRTEEFRIDTDQLLRRAMPDHDELMRRMEEHMKRVEEMIKQLQLQQDELRQRVEKTPVPEA